MRSLFLLAALAGCTPSDPEPTYLTAAPTSEPVLVSMSENALTPEEQLMNEDREALVVGSNCGYAGYPPPGTLAVSSLVRLEDVAALTRLTQAPTIEARLYATIGLWELGVIDDARLARFVAGISSPVWSCSGCMYGNSSATDALLAYGIRRD